MSRGSKKPRSPSIAQCESIDGDAADAPAIFTASTATDPNSSAAPSLTPMVRQYNQMKAAYPDHLLLFRMGDFYETFNDDAKIAAEVLDIALTKRGHAPSHPISDARPGPRWPGAHESKFIAVQAARDTR